MKKFKKYLIAAALAGVFGYGAYENENIFYVIKNPSSIQFSWKEGVDIDLQRILDDYGYNVGDNLGYFIDFNRSDEYFLRKLSREDYSKLIDKEKLKTNLLDRLDSKDHTYRQHYSWSENYGIPDESHGQITKCNIVQLLKLYIALNSFEDKEVCNKIGNLIRDDVKDYDHEHGGLVKLRNLKLVFRPYPSAEKGNEFYLSSDEYLEEDAMNDCFAHYHFHATTNDDARYAGPSGYWNIWGGDISYFCTSWIIDEGYIEFVITKLKGNNFNVDACLRNYKEGNQGIIIDMGNYSYK